MRCTQGYTAPNTVHPTRPAHPVHGTTRNPQKPEPLRCTHRYTALHAPQVHVCPPLFTGGPTAQDTPTDTPPQADRAVATRPPHDQEITS